MNASVSSEKEKVKESQSQSRRVTPPLDIQSVAGLGASHRNSSFMTQRSSTLGPLSITTYHLIPAYRQNYMLSIFMLSGSIQFHSSVSVYVKS